MQNKGYYWWEIAIRLNLKYVIGVIFVKLIILVNHPQFRGNNFVPEEMI